MTDIAIRVDNPWPEQGRRISKLYPELSARAYPELSARTRHIGALHQRPNTPLIALRTSLRDALTAPFRRKHDHTTTRPHGSPDGLWALCDVSFVARRGEVVG